MKWFLMQRGKIAIALSFILTLPPMITPKSEAISTPRIRTCSETEIQTYLRQLNIPSRRAIQQPAYTAIVSECRASAVPTLTKALKNPGKHIRSNASLALGEIGEEAIAAIPALIETLDDDRAIVRQNAAYALGQMGSNAESALPALSERLKDQNRAVIASAAYAVGRIGASLQNRSEELSTATAESLYAALFNALNDLYISRDADPESYKQDANAENAFFSIIDTINTLNMIDYLYADLDPCKNGVRSLECLSGGTQLVASIQTHIDRNRPAICQIVPIRYILPRCKTR